MVNMTSAESELLVNAPLYTTPESPSNVEPYFYNVLSHHMYDSVKYIWGYGCGISMAKPILKKTEDVATKVLNYTTGIHLEKGDTEIKPKLAEFDAKYMNPAITRLVGVLSPYYEKADDQLRPLIAVLIKKLYFLPQCASTLEKEA